MDAPNVMPKYQVEKLDGTFTRTIAKFNDETHRLEYEEVECERGWMIYFPQGHSMHITNAAEMKRLGYTDGPSMVDMETGDDVVQLHQLGNTPKDVVQRRTRETKPAAGNIDLESPLDNAPAANAEA